jgi:fatty-acyl-CoA synthase
MATHPANHVPLSPVSFLQRSGDVYPDTPAIRDPYATAAQTLSYGQFRTAADRLAGALRGAGLRPGDRVAALTRNSPEMLQLHFGVPGTGAVLVPMNTRLAPREYAHILEHSGASLLFVDHALVHQVAGVLDDLRLRAVIGLSSGGHDAAAAVVTEDFASWVAAHDDGSGMQLPEDELAPLAINYTSGTTGGPKGAVYTHRGAYLNAVGQALELQLSARDTYLWTLPMFHCDGWCFTWAVTAAGARHVCLRDFDPEVALRLIAQERVTRFCGAPVVLNSMAQCDLAAELSFDQEVIGAVGGAPPAPATIRAMQDLGVSVVHLYGLTETYGPSTICEVQPDWDDGDVDAYAERVSRQGVRTINVADVRVVDDRLQPVPADAATLGEIVVRSNTVMQGYFRDPEQTDAAFAGGWFHTGDLAVVHPDGYIEIRDRSKDVIISGGENVSSIEVENVLMSHPAVSEVAVVARPDERWGEVPVAFVALRDGAEATEQDMIDWVRERLAHYKAPKAVTFAALPKTSTGKIQKFELRRQVRAGAS